jgi:hypothetical protein
LFKFSVDILITGYLHKKIVRLELLEPKDINDFAPLLRASHLTLTKIIRAYHAERNKIPEGSRIYYLAKRLDVEPALVAKYVTTPTFMFFMNFGLLNENLDIMLVEYEINPLNILSDLWALQYTSKTIRDRFERCKLGGKKNLRPWMVRCPEEVLETSLKLTQENKNLFGDSSLLHYIAQRLGFEASFVEGMIQRHPNVLKCKAKKVKEVLDYLLEEEKFEPIEVLSVIRILVHSLETTKQRLKELKAIGCRPSTLTIVCRSQNEYAKFVRAWLKQQE